jgi:hypothetical protein
MPKLLPAEFNQQPKNSAGKGYSGQPELALKPLMMSRSESATMAIWGHLRAENDDFYHIFF